MFVPLTPLRFLRRAADLFASQVGVVCDDRQFTYAEFAGRCARLGGALGGLGVRPDDPVAYLSFNTHRLLEAYYGVLEAGGIVMPLNVRLSPPELAAILRHSGARVLFFEPDFAPLADSLRPALQRAVCLGDEYEELLAAAAPRQADIPSVDENKPAELFYTSGSTGTPKGVVLYHRTLYLHGMHVAACMGGSVESIVDLHTIPLFHANGWGRPHASTMLGVKQVMVRRFEPSAVLALVERHRATHMCLVPTMANALLNAPDAARYDLSSLRQVMIGGAASSPELIERLEKLTGCQCVAGYGLTETSPVITIANRKRGVEPASEAERFRRQAMAGWAIPGVELRVVDPALNDVARDGRSIGEIVARGDQVMDGYYNDPEGTAAAMSGGWLHTGDMAVWDEHGYIHIVDRKKEIIISGGENISSLEVEKAIFAHPEVYEVAVVAAPDDTWGEVPAAIVYRKPGSSLTSAGLLEFLAGRLARFKLPRLIEFTGEPLPKSGTGKLRKLQLREKLWAGKERRVQG